MHAHTHTTCYATHTTQGPDQSHGEGIWSIGDGTKAPGKWWRLETNFDHWAAFQDGRRAAANVMMNKIGQDHLDLAQLYKLLSTPPVLAGDTVYTALMWPKTGRYDTTIRQH
jgi:hypothetical protein